MASTGILVVAVAQRASLPPATFELISAGLSLKEPVSAVVLGDAVAPLAEDLATRGVSRVYAIENPALAGFSEEVFAKAVAQLALKEGFGKILLAANVAGRALSARLAVALKAGLATDVSAILADGTVQRSYYSGNLLATVSIKSPVSVLCMAPMAFARAQPTGTKAEIVKVALDASSTKTSFASFVPETSSEIDMGSAERIVSGGRGLGGAEGFKKVYELAHALGAAVGASRAAVDSGWIAYPHQVGLTGRSVRPKLYVAVGISGQIQHLAGMSSSGTIVAINTDKDCPMMQMANVSVQGDYNELLPLVSAEIKKRKGSAA